MAYGVEITNTSGSFQLSETLTNYVEIKSFTTNLTGSTDTDGDGAYEKVVSVSDYSREIDDIIAINCTVPICAFANTSPAGVRLISFNSSTATVKVKIFRRMDRLTNSSSPALSVNSGYGLEIFDASGVRRYASNYKPLRVSSTVSGNAPTETSLDLGSSPGYTPYISSNTACVETYANTDAEDDPDYFGFQAVSVSSSNVCSLSLENIESSVWSDPNRSYPNTPITALIIKG